MRADADALMTIAIVAGTTEGGMGIQQLMRLQTLARHSPEFRQLHDISTYVCIMVGKTAREGKAAALRRSTATLTPGLREKAYAWALTMISSEKTGNTFLNTLRRQLKIRH